MTKQTLIALVLLIIGKISGFTGVMFGFNKSLYSTGGALLIVAFICVWSSIILALKDKAWITEN